MEKTRPLHRWMTLQFALVASVPLAVVAVFVWLFLLPQIRADVGIRHQTLASAIAGQVSVHLQGAEIELRAVGDYIDKQDHRPASFWFELKLASTIRQPAGGHHADGDCFTMQELRVPGLSFQGMSETVPKIEQSADTRFFFVFSYDFSLVHN